MARLADSLRNAIRPSTTRSTGALWAKSLLNAVLFFGVFMVALPWAAHALLGAALPVPAWVRSWAAPALAFAGIGVWAACLDTFSRQGRGTPLPLDAPRELVTGGLFAFTRNPIMIGELSVVWAEVLFFASAGIALYALALTAFARFSVVRVEEPELRARFGAVYEDYCRRVPRWLPRPR